MGTNIVKKERVQNRRPYFFSTFEKPYFVNNFDAQIK